MRKLILILLVSTYVLTSGLFVWRRYYACSLERYSLIATHSLGDQVQQGARIVTRPDGSQGVVLFAHRSGCLQLEYWAKNSGLSWTEDSTLPDGLWIRGTPALRPVRERYCTTASPTPDPFSSSWDISPDARRLAWIAPQEASATSDPYSAFVADIPAGGSVQIGSPLAVKQISEQAPSSRVQVRFQGDDRLLLLHDTGQVSVWDLKNNNFDPRLTYRVAKDAKEVAVRRNAIASSDLDEGQVVISTPDGYFSAISAWQPTTLGALSPDALTSDTPLDPPQPSSASLPLASGTTLALSGNYMAALGSTIGTFGIVQLDRQAPQLKHVLAERSSPLSGLPIDQISWIDDTDLALGGRGGVYATALHEVSPGQFEIGDTYTLVQDSSIAGVPWLETDGRLLVYGKKRSAPVVGLLHQYCASPSSADLYSQLRDLTAAFSTLLAVLGAIALASERSRAAG